MSTLIQVNNSENSNSNSSITVNTNTNTITNSNTDTDNNNSNIISNNNRKRAIKKRNDDDKVQMDVAVNLVLKNKLSLRAAAHLYKIPFSTLRTRKICKFIFSIFNIYLSN